MCYRCYVLRRQCYHMRLITKKVKQPLIAWTAEGFLTNEARRKFVNCRVFKGFRAKGEEILVVFPNMIMLTSIANVNGLIITSCIVCLSSCLLTTSARQRGKLLFLIIFVQPAACNRFSRDGKDWANWQIWSQCQTKILVIRPVEADPCFAELPVECASATHESARRSWSPSSPTPLSKTLAR